jgi:two-component system sensor histidine kinase KdpD
MTTPPSIPPLEPISGIAGDHTPLRDAPEPGRLRVYLGAAPGVGKTYRMLEDAHLMRRQGIDIVIGLIEAHSRADTAALVEGLEIVPLQEVQYRSVTLREMNIEAILAHHPTWCINVMTAMNVQHLETLNDAVARSASTTIRETVPDSFLRRANEVVNVDITIDELRDRLRQGKIYAPEKVEQALANFFRKGNLNMLRELALRTTAEQVGTAAAEYRRTQGLEQAPIPEKVMVCLSPRSGMERLVRVGARIAGRLASNWFVVYVETPATDHRHGDPAAFARLEEYQRMARDLGARIVVLKDKKVADALIAFARKENISHVVFGQSARSRWEIFLGGSIINRFLNEMRDTTVQVVPVQKERK